MTWHDGDGFGFGLVNDKERGGREREMRRGREREVD
jgi:hypothetical protein